MRWVFLFFIALYLQANVLNLPVKYDPFKKAKKIIRHSHTTSPLHYETPSVRLDLIAIFNDKAYINGKFYTIGQKVYGYKLIDIKEKYVVLRKGRQVKILPLVKKKILKTSER